MSTFLPTLRTRRGAIQHLLDDAIERRLLVRIAFDGCVRDIQPHALTHTRRGLSVQATQVGGMTRSLPERGARVFAVQAIDDAAPMDDRLVPPLPWFRLAKVLRCVPLPKEDWWETTRYWQVGLVFSYYDLEERAWWKRHHHTSWNPEDRVWANLYDERSGYLGDMLDVALDRGYRVEIRRAEEQRALQTLFRAQGFRDDVPVPTVRYYTAIPPADTLWWAASDAERPHRTRRLPPPPRRLPAVRRRLPRQWW